MTEGRAIVREALQKPEVKAFGVAHAHALYVGAALALMQSDFVDALPLLAECLALRRKEGSPTDVAATLSTLAKVQLRLRHDPAHPGEESHAPGHALQARASASEALALLQSVGDKVGEAIALQDLGQIEYFVGDLVTARHWIERSLAAAKSIKHQEVEAECERILGEISFEEENDKEARLHMARASEICAAAGDKRGAACVQLWQGKLALKCGDVAQAKLDLSQALAMFQASKMRAEWLDGLLAIADIAALDNAWIPAIGVVAAVQASQSRAHMALSHHARVRCEKLLALLEAQVDTESAQDAKNAGSGWDAALTSATAMKICL